MIPATNHNLMKIKKIELNGFKSFADRTVFNLHSGITCIVGPNGCGKSNIVDAFRWVLGEQSAKTLRGGKMEEVIFDGSAVKKPKGMSDVTLHISDIDPTSDGNGSSGKTTTVARRLYRSGDSEYLINKNSCRLKDIKDLFLDTGLEVKSYSIIEQGHIDRILSTKPDDRRFLIEEVAGVIKYKVRKEEALRKLESSRLNLQRISDVISEIKKQINILNRLAKKAERYKILSEELKSIELKISKKKYTELRETLEKTNEEFERTKEEDSSLRASISTLETGYQKERLEVVQKEKELNQSNEDFMHLERIVADINQQTAVLNAEVNNSRNQVTRLSALLTELDEKKADLASKVSDLTSEKSGLNAQLEEFNTSVAEKKDFIYGIEQDILDIENNIEEKRKDIFRITETLSTLNNDLTRLQSVLESMSKKEEGYNSEIEGITSEMEKIESEIGRTDSMILNKTNDLSMINERREKLQNEIGTAREKMESMQSTISSLKEELASDSSRLESLKEIASEGLTKDILNQSETMHVAGVVSDVISVDTRYEKALESVLSEKINGLILSSFDDIEFAVRFIRENTLMRTALMVIDESPFEDSNIPSNESIIGRASDFVNADDRYKPLVRKLLSNVVLVRDLRNAADLSSATRGLIFVTPGGDIIDTTGTVLAGEGKGILKRKREIRELSAKTDEKQARLERYERELAGLKESVEGHEREINGIKEKLVLTEKELSVHRVELQNLHMEKERLQKKKAFIKIEMEQTRQEKENIQKNSEDTKKNISETSVKRSEMEGSLDSLRQRLTEKKEFYEQYRGELEAIRIEMTSYKEKMESLSKEIQSFNDSMEETDRKKEDTRAEIEHTQLLIEEKTGLINELNERLKGQVLQIDGLKGEISARKAKIEEMSEVLQEKEKKIKVIREDLENVSSRLSSAEIARTEHRIKMENIFNNQIDKYGINIEQLETPEPTEEELEKVESLREKIQTIGPVNLGTIEEYEELKERYEFLTSQHEDLTKSIEELEEAIRKINYTTRKRLREAFTQLNKKFSEVFIQLFDGGKANLILTDEQNILESGIDIIAQPPGKKLQNISLLSGGEKALTAISLIFAGFLIKPAPICILDEADAPLDESNAGKYAAMLRELSKGIQFVVITHNRTTMEAADHIYGITMEEPGISKVISMQLAEA
ncbi:MAG: chromosome segregation protein SMC [Thermodesulfovibrionales bacterium]